MAQKKSRSISSTDHARLIALLEGTLSESEFTELEADLRTQPELRAAWINLQDQESELQQRFTNPPPTPGQKVVKTTILWSAITAICVFIAALAIRPADQSSFTTVALPGQDEVAIVMSLEGVTWKENTSEPVKVGTYLKPGTLQLAEGKMELIFLSGATVAIEGPAEIQILSEKLAYLNHGKAAARVPEEAIGFTLKTPDAAIVDLGTEFAANVSQSGESQVHVYDGEVHVSLLGEDGSTLSGARLHTGQAATVTPKLHALSRETTANSTTLPRVSAQNHSLLVIPDEYRKAISEAKPIIYWTFDETPADAKIVGNVTPIQSAGNTALHFHQGGYITSTKLIPELNQSNYTIEMWVKPERFQHATIFGLFRKHPSDEEAVPSHLTVIELAHESHLIHRPNSIRFLHRWPTRSEHKGSEVNAFSQTPFLPGKWIHITAVKEPTKISIYLNGQLNRSVEKIVENHDTDYQLILGQIDSLRPSRQFSGLLDEFSLYSRALTSKEIATHYSIVSVANIIQLSD